MDSASTLHLSFGDHMHDFDAARQNPGAAKRLEPQHGSRAPIDRRMVLLGEVVEMFGLADPDRPTKESAAAASRFVAPGRIHNHAERYFSFRHLSSNLIPSTETSSRYVLPGHAG
ncbi:hypothetical protein P3T22_006402 [Paraburkholderia sp. GAS348]